MKARFFYILFLILCSATESFSQNDSAAKKEMEFKIGTFYNSNLNYYGRTDSLRSSGVFPLAEIWFNKAIYISAAPVFVNNSTQTMRYAGTVAMLGYYKKADSEKFITHIWFTKPFNAD